MVELLQKFRTVQGAIVMMPGEKGILVPAIRRYQKYLLILKLQIFTIWKIQE